jgi:DNA replication protein DnaC|tara:strand:+ start:1543 stop:2181 length:639 start_codon:yes stop_codon:yes gene_type:complete
MTNSINEENLKYLEKDRKDILNQIPIRFSDVKKEDIPQNVLKVFDDILDEKGLYMFGSCGVGKTHIAWSLFKHKTEQRFSEAREYLGKKGNEGRHVSVRSNIQVYSWVEVLRLLRDSMINKEKYRGAYSIEEDFDPQILILDDVGSEKASDWTIETLYYLINKRYEEKKPTIITSNLPLSELADKVGDRITSRIAEMCEIVRLEGKDKRLEK